MAYCANTLRRSIPHATRLAGLGLLGLGAMSDKTFAACTGTAPNFVCAAAETSPQTISVSGPLSVTTTSGFGVNATGGSALYIAGQDSVSYIDDNASALDSTDGYGLFMQTSPTGTGPVSLTIRTDGDISGAGGGIWVQGYGANSGDSVDIKANNVSSSSGYGLYATSSGALKVEAADISGQGGSGLLVQMNGGSNDGPISVKADSVSGSTGATVYSGMSTDVTVNIGAIAAQSQGFILMGSAFSGGPGTSVTLGTVTAESSQGIAIQTPNGDRVSLSVDTLTLKNGGYGIFYYGSAFATNTISAGTITGDANSTGMHAYVLPNGGTGVSSALNIKAGNIEVGQYGIFALTFAPLSIDVGSVKSTNGIGIYGYGFQPISVQAGSVTAMAGNGIEILGGAPDASIKVKAIDVSAGQFAISTFGTNTTQIVTDGLVRGGIAAITASGWFGEPIVIENRTRGVLQNMSGLSTDLAVTTQGGPTTLTNSGKLTGVLQLASGLANEVFNQGLWNTAGGANDFGGSAILTNAAGGTVLAGGGPAPVTTAFNNLTSFENGGRLVLAGGAVGNTLTTDANVQLKAGSEVAIGVNTAGQSDRLVTSGTLAIDGKLAVSYTDGFRVNTRYTVATAGGGVSGHWRSVTAYSAFLGLIDTYDANHAYLTAGQARPFADAGLTRNQIATAAGLDSMPKSGPLFDALMMQGNDAQARHAFDQLSGEIYGSAKAALVEDSRFVREAATDRLRNAFGTVAAPAMAVMSYAVDNSRGTIGPMPKPPANDHLAVWGQAFGAWGQMDTDHNAGALHRSVGGVLLGADVLVADGWRAGLETGYSRSHVEAKSLGAKLDSDNYHLGVYAGTQWGYLGFRSGLAYTWHRLDGARNIAFEGFGDRARGQYGAGTFQTFGEVGYRIDGWVASFEPFVNLAYVNVTDGSFDERGGAAALRVDGKAMDTAFNTLGMRASRTFDFGGQSVTLSGMAGWRHAYGDATPLSSHIFTGGNAFTVAGVPIARDALALEAAADIALSHATRIGIRYNGQAANVGDQHNVKANLAVRF